MQSLEGQSFGDYEIQAKLGQGGMGAVYKAQQTLLKRTVALKVMAPQLAEDPAYAARFVREAAAAANLNHPNMVLVYTAGKIDGTHYIAMEFVDGESLRKRLDREGRLDPREAVAITVYITQALQYAWNKARLIHRDIKPDNIFLSKAGEVKVGDLGLAKSVGSASTDLTASGMAMGSPHYISPEQARGLKDIDFRADIYSLGCTLYHMLTGRTPYDGDDSMSIMMKHVNDPPPAIFKVWPQCPMPLGMLVGRMLAKDRNTRHRSYEDLLADLLAVHDKLKHVEVPAPVAPAPAPARTSTPPAPVSVAKAKARDSKAALRNSKLVIGSAVAVVVLLLAGLFLWSPWKSRTDEQGRREDAKTEVSSASPQRSTTPSLQYSVSAADSALRTPHSAFLGSVYTNSVGGEMVYIPPGEFMMGSTKEEQAWAVANGANEDSVGREGEAPRKTSIKQGFWLGRTEVTIGQWKQFVAATGHVTDAEKRGLAHAILEDGRFGETKGANWRNPGLKPEDNHPVTCVSWNDAVEFCKWLTEQERKTGRLPAGRVIRLPSEAEWEYACRAGTQTKFWWGDTVEDGNNRLNWIGTTDGFKCFSPVDHYEARGRNAFGLADMLGNVYEWCLDEYDATQAHEEPFRGNPKERVARGGCFCYSPGANRCACRNAAGSFATTAHYGFRMCCGVDVAGATTTTLLPSPAAAPKEGGILAPAETRVAALTANPKVGEVCALDLGGGATMELMGIPPGEFMMGSMPEEQAWALANGVKDGAEKREGEVPRKTAIKEGFWLGRTEVTVSQWKDFVAATGYKTDAEKKGEANYAYDRQKKTREGNVKGASWRTLGFDQQDNHPVCCVSWNDAMAFCEWLTERERKAGRLPAGQVVRLPTEAEWEYACRAGTQAKFWWGEAKEDGKDRLNWSAPANGYEFTSPVDAFGSRGRNGFALADMLGNVFEWCLDDDDSKQAHEECYKGNPGARVLRGGTFPAAPGYCRCAYRHSANPANSHCYNGFRVAVGVDLLGTTTATATTPPSAMPKEGGILAPAETRVAALTAKPKVGEVCALDLGGGVTMELMGIPPGEFMLGSTKEEQAWAVANRMKDEDVKREGEAPRKATIKQGFWMGRTEVTVGQWKRFVGAAGYQTDGEKKGEAAVSDSLKKAWAKKQGASWREPGFGFPSKDNHPVCCVSWNDAVAFCEWLNQREQKTGPLPAGHRIRLPTEAEWEYACRAGTQAKFWWGDTREEGDGRLNWSGMVDGFELISPVDHYVSRGRNRFGLADMLGNVREWCLDGFDPEGAHEELYRHCEWARVLRGGGFTSPAYGARCAYREPFAPVVAISSIGFRVCVGPDVLGSAATTAAPVPPHSSLVTPADPQLSAFCREVAALPAEAQVQRVVAKLKELNPGFDGKVERKIENGAVAVLLLNEAAIADISPLAALSGLRVLSLDNTKISDLSPLKGMALRNLNCGHSSVSDLSVLRGMPLEILYFTQTEVGDLSPLAGMPLDTLSCQATRVHDLSPLKGMKLTGLVCDRTQVTDLSPLTAMPLKRLRCDFVPARDTAILRSVKTLETINNLPAAEFWKRVEAGKTPQPSSGPTTSAARGVPAQPGVNTVFVREIAALPAEAQVQRVVAKLKELNPEFDGKAMPAIENGEVKEFAFSQESVTDISPVRALTRLRKLMLITRSGQRSLADISPLRGLQLVNLYCAYTRVADLSPLEGMRLDEINCGHTQVADLTPLKGMPLRSISFHDTRVRDLSPLAGTRILSLNCYKTQVSDLSPLRGMPLRVLGCDFVRERDAAILRSIKTLETINDLPAAEFWKRVEAGETPQAK
ncbi:MAG: SUMF1/EgtB/PvdO family nonheme iron enzyme [Verrucomicrobiia bacterium]